MAMKKSPILRQAITVPVSSLKPYPNNPRKHTAKQIRQIADSILKFGFTNPVIIDKDARAQPIGSFELMLRTLVHRAIYDDDFAAVKEVLRICEKYKVIKPPGVRGGGGDGRQTVEAA